MLILSAVYGLLQEGAPRRRWRGSRVMRILFGLLLGSIHRQVVYSLDLFCISPICQHRWMILGDPPILRNCIRSIVHLHRVKFRKHQQFFLPSEEDSL